MCGVPFLNRINAVGKIRKVDINETIIKTVKKKDVVFNTARTEYGDMFDLSQFRDQEFDYTYCDPPFEVYTSGKDRMRWQYELFRITKKAMLTRRPKVNINMPSKRHHWIVLEDSRPSLSLVRIDWR